MENQQPEIIDVESTPVKTIEEMDVREKNQESILKVSQLSSMNVQLEQIKSMTDGMSNMMREQLKLDATDASDEMVNKLTVAFPDEESIVNATDEEIERIVAESGYDVKETFKDESVAFKRELIKFLVVARTQFNEYNEKSKELETEVASLMVEVEELCKDFGDSANLMRATFKENYDQVQEAGSPALQSHLEKCKYAVDSAFDLDCVYNWFAEMKPINTFNEYLDPDRRASVEKKYSNTMKKLNVTPVFHIVKDFEEKFLDEKYHVLKGLLLYTVLKYIGSRSMMADRTVEGLFISQLQIIFCSLYAGTLTEENKEVFIKSCERLLDRYL